MSGIICHWSLVAFAYNKKLISILLKIGFLVDTCVCVQKCFRYVCVFVFRCTRVYTGACVYECRSVRVCVVSLYVCVRVRVFVNVCICVFQCAYGCACLCEYPCVCLFYVVRVCIRMHVFISVWAYAFVFRCTYAYAGACV